MITTIKSGPRFQAVLRVLSFALLLLLETVFTAGSAYAAEGPDSHDLLLQVLTSEDEATQIELLGRLGGEVPDELVEEILTQWPRGGVYVHLDPNGSKIPFMFDPETAGEEEVRGIGIFTGEYITGADGEPVLFYAIDLLPLYTSAPLRRAIRTTLDLFSLADPNPNIRRDAAITLGVKRDLEYLPYFHDRLETEDNRNVRKALNEAIGLTLLGSPDHSEKLEGIESLGEIGSIVALDFLEDIEEEAAESDTEQAKEIAAACQESIKQIRSHIAFSDFIGTCFRGLSLSAVLLIAALGLAITFGLMGVINMAHGEVIMFGAYTAYVTQNVFINLFGESGFGFNMYFPAAIVMAFITGGLLGLLLERCVIRFLYKRPLESLLATWGVSLVLQQLVRVIFGAANVQVTSPSWLNGNITHNDVTYAYNRIFLVGFAVIIVILTWFILSKTSLGLQVRAVMQNRSMASCMGVRTDRVNMATFAFGSGLAGVAGACFSQIGNVSPNLGQNHIIDCFMVVVLGGVGNLIGTICAALGIGVSVQVLEPKMGAVLGKIIVLTAIILFLQWRPAGMFATRSRSLD